MESPVGLTTLFFLVVLLRQSQPVQGWEGCCGVECDSCSWPQLFRVGCVRPTCCDSEPSNPGSGLAPGSLEIEVEYRTVTIAEQPVRQPALRIGWNYTVAPMKAVKVTVSLDQSHQVLCYSVSPGRRSVVAHSLPNPLSSNAYDCRGYNVTVRVLLGGSSSSSHVVSLEKKVLVEDCWTVVGRKKSLEVCGKQIPSAPLNVSAELRVNSSTGVSTIAVNWSPPLHHNSPVDKYIVKLCTSDDFCETRTAEPPNRTLSANSGQFEELELASVVSVRVAAAVELLYSCDFCCERYFGYFHREDLPNVPVVATTTMQPIVSSLSIVAPTPAASFPSIHTSADTSRWIVVGTSVVGGVLVLAVCLTAVAVAALAVGLRRKTEQSGSMLLTPAKFEKEASMPSNSVIDTVFLVSSPEESEETQERLRHLVHDLADHGIEAVYYQYERAAQHADSPGALGIARWVEHQFQRCDLVLFACTRTFSTEWSRENGDVMIPVVWSSRHVLDGILPHQDDISRFGVVLMGDNCDIPPSLRRFQVFPVFQRGGGSEAVHTERLVEYIYQTPLHAPPPVSRASAVRASL